MSHRPGGLTILCIGCLVLGGLGVLMWCLGGVGLAMQASGIDPAQIANSGLPPEQQAAQQQMQQEVEAITKKWWIVTAVLWVWNVPTIILLMTGAVLGLRMAPTALKWLKIALINVLVFEVVRLVPTIAMQIEMADVMERMFQGLAGPGGRAPPAGLMKIGMGIGLAFVALMVVVKLSFYGWGLWYVGRNEVRDWFGAPDLDDESEAGWDDRPARA